MESSARKRPPGRRRAAAAGSRPGRYRARTRSPRQASAGPARLVPWIAADRRGPPAPPSLPARPCSPGQQDLEGARLGGDGRRSSADLEVVGVKAHAGPGLHLQPREPEDLSGSILFVLEQGRGDGATHYVCARSACVHRELQVRIARGRIADRDQAADRRCVAEDQRHRRSAALEITAELVLETFRCDHVSQHAWKRSELHVLGGVAQRDGLAKQTDGAGFDEDISVDATQRDLPRVSATRHCYGVVNFQRQAESPRKVVEGSQWKDADRMPGVGETADHELHRPVTAGDDHPCARRDELLEFQLGIEIDDEVVRESSPEPGFEVGCHSTGAAADDEQAAGRCGGLHRAQWWLPSRRTQRAQAKEWSPSAMNPRATAPRSWRPSGCSSRKRNAPLNPWAAEGSRCSPATRTNQPTRVKVTPLDTIPTRPRVSTILFSALFISTRLRSCLNSAL